MLYRTLPLWLIPKQDLHIPLHALNRCTLGPLRNNNQAVAQRSGSLRIRRTHPKCRVKTNPGKHRGYQWLTVLQHQHLGGIWQHLDATRVLLIVQLKVLRRLMRDLHSTPRQQHPHYLCQSSTRSLYQMWIRLRVSRP